MNEPGFVLALYVFCTCTCFVLVRVLYLYVYYSCVFVVSDYTHNATRDPLFFFFGV